MASYIVLARKWRPQTFADLVGQQHVAVTLQNAIAQNRVAHAFLFTGSRGVGKTSTARIFAKALNCAKAPCHEPCNECDSCREITDGHSMDVIEIDGASNRGINEIREVLDAVRYAPSRDRYKIYIIDEVHMLTTEAFNALLKTLEEPPPHVIFIFATTDPNKIPITIVSRCQRYDFKRIQTADLVDHLDRIAKAENIAFESSALHLIARTARGGVRDALSAMDQIIAFSEQPITGERAAEVLGVASRETLMKMVESLIRRDVPGVLSCIEHVDHYGQNLSQFAFDLLEFLRDVTVLWASNGKASMELNPQEQQIAKSWLPLTSFDRMQRMFNIWYQTSEMLPKSLSPRLVMEMAAIKMCQVETVVPLDNIVRKIDAIARALGSGPNLGPEALEHVQAYLKSHALGPDIVQDEKKKSGAVSPEPQDIANNDRNSAADDIKPAATSAAPNPVQPQITAAPKPSPEPPKLAPEPPKPAPEPPKPATEPPKPVVEPPKPVVEPPKPVVEPPKPAPEPPKPVVEAPKPAPVAPKPAVAAAPNPAPSADQDFDDFLWNDDSVSSQPTEEDYQLLAAMDADYAEIDDDGDDDDEPTNAQENKKSLAVSANRPKYAQPGLTAVKPEVDAQHRWKQVVSMLKLPISNIMARARVDCITDNDAEITLPNAYANIVTDAHVKELQRLLTRVVGPNCYLTLRYDEIGDETETLAAQKAREIIEAQNAKIENTKQHPMMKAILEKFHIEPDAVRFTINQDR